MFKAWESFLEKTLIELMIGVPTISGRAPVRYVAPPNADIARKIVVGTNRYFDYANHDNMKKIANFYFKDGYPYEPHLSAISSDLGDLRTMRNAEAHISSTTQAALDALALRILARPHTNIALYELLIATDPRSATGETVFASYKTKLVVTAELVTQG